MRVPFAFLFCTIVGLKKLEMGASIHRPIFARGPAHYSAEERRLLQQLHTADVLLHLQQHAGDGFLLSCAVTTASVLCLVAAANDTVHVGGEKERGILRIVQEKKRNFPKNKGTKYFGRIL